MSDVSCCNYKVCDAECESLGGENHITKRFLSTQAETICGLMCDLRRAYERNRHRGLRFHQLPLRSTAGTFRPVFRPFPSQPERCVHPKLQAHTAREVVLGDQPLAST